MIKLMVFCLEKTIILQEYILQWIMKILILLSWIIHDLFILYEAFYKTKLNYNVMLIILYKKNISDMYININKKHF